MEGDSSAAKQLVDYLYPFVIRVVRGHLPRALDEEDLAQEIFQKFFSRLDQFHGQVPVENWVSRMALTTCFDALRKQQRRPEWRMADLSEEQELVVSRLRMDDAGQSEVDAGVASELVEKLLGFLDPEDAAILRWMEMEDKTVKQVQDLTGWSVARIKVRAFRARHKLRKIYTKIIEREARDSISTI